MTSYDSELKFETVRLRAVRSGGRSVGHNNKRSGGGGGGRARDINSEAQKR